MGIRKDLHGGCPNDDNDLSEEEEMEGHRKGKKAKQNDYYFPPSSFTLSQQETEQCIRCLLGVKFPSGYAGKISRYLDAAKKSSAG